MRIFEVDVMSLWPLSKVVETELIKPEGHDIRIPKPTREDREFALAVAAGDGAPLQRETFVMNLNAFIAAQKNGKVCALLERAPEWFLASKEHVGKAMESAISGQNGENVTAAYLLLRALEKSQVNILAGNSTGRAKSAIAAGLEQSVDRADSPVFRLLADCAGLRGREWLNNEDALFLKGANAGESENLNILMEKKLLRPKNILFAVHFHIRMPAMNGSEAAESRVDLNQKGCDTLQALLDRREPETGHAFRALREERQRLTAVSAAARDDGWHFPQPGDKDVPVLPDGELKTLVLREIFAMNNRKRGDLDLHLRKSESGSGFMCVHLFNHAAGEVVTIQGDTSQASSQRSRLDTSEGSIAAKGQKHRQACQFRNRAAA